MKPDSSPEADRNQDPQEGLLTFPLEGLLPANQTLVLNLSMRSATLLSASPDGEAQVLSQQRFRPNGIRVLLPLLKAYPGFCTYDVLVASLLSLTLDQARRRSDIEWVHGDLSSVRWDGEFDLVVMTGHAFQEFVADDDRAELAVESADGVELLVQQCDS